MDRTKCFKCEAPLPDTSRISGCYTCPDCLLEQGKQIVKIITGHRPDED